MSQQPLCHYELRAALERSLAEARIIMQRQHPRDQSPEMRATLVQLEALVARVDEEMALADLGDLTLG